MLEVDDCADLGLADIFQLGSSQRSCAVGRRSIGRKRLVHISEELRCLVCQNESLASSRAELANDLREEVRKLIRQDKSDTQIKEYLVARYGDFVLYKPEVKPLTWVLWFGPFLLLVLGVFGMTVYLRQRQSAQTAQVSLSDEDRRKVQNLLKSGEAP